ncbi:hypothetical protein ACWD4T_52980, partial [Streptomyces umbrinus]
MYSPPPDPDTEQRMRAHHARAAEALDVRAEPGGEFWGWAGRTLGTPARTATGQPAWLRLVSSPEDKAAGKLWDGAVDAQHVFGDLDGRADGDQALGSDWIRGAHEAVVSSQPAR